MDLTGVPWAAITTLVGVIATLFFTNWRESSRQEFERSMKLREEKRQAYADMVRVSKNLVATEPHTDTDLGDAHAAIELLTDKDDLIETAGRLLEAVASARGILWDLEQDDVKRPYVTPRYQNAKAQVENERADFIRMAKDELKHKPEPPWWARLFGAGPRS